VTRWRSAPPRRHEWRCRLASSDSPLRECLREQDKITAVTARGFDAGRSLPCRLSSAYGQPGPSRSPIDRLADRDSTAPGSHLMRVGFRVRGMIPAALVSRRSAGGADIDEVRGARNEARLLLSRVYRPRPAARCRNESTSLRHDLHLDPTASADHQVSAIFTMLLNVFTCLLLDPHAASSSPMILRRGAADVSGCGFQIRERVALQFRCSRPEVQDWCRQRMPRTHENGASLDAPSGCLVAAARWSGRDPSRRFRPRGPDAVARSAAVCSRGRGGPRRCARRARARPSPRPACRRT